MPLRGIELSILAWFGSWKWSVVGCIPTLSVNATEVDSLMGCRQHYLAYPLCRFWDTPLLQGDAFFPIANSIRHSFSTFMRSKPARGCSRQY